VSLNFGDNIAALTNTEEYALMSDKRTGRVQFGIRYAFITDPDRAWSTRELMGWTHALALYQGRRSRRNRQNYCRSIHRAALGLGLERVGRRWPDGALWRLVSDGAGDGSNE
jgi:hypothetical protein